MNRPNIARLIRPASSIRIITRVSIPSKNRGGAKKYVGPISRRSCSIVSGLSGQATQNPAHHACPIEKMKSPTQAIGRYARTLSSAVRWSNSALARAVSMMLRFDSTTPFGRPVVPEV